jgi:hypothetical protein
MSNKKPEPIFPASKPNLCPVCGEVTYSAAGIHPQCAVKQADQKRRAILDKAASETMAPKKKLDGQQQSSRWQKVCPKCSQSLHVRKKICGCGHAFAKTLPKSD